MMIDRDFSLDVEFTKLLLRDRDIDLTLVALEIARDANPQLEFDETLNWIAARAEELRERAAGAWSEADALRGLASLLSEEHGLTGSAEAYQFPESSYLPAVIAQRRGIPISLSILYMAVARQAGIELKGVAAPQHFLTRFDGTEGTFFLDAFGGGQIMNRAECLDFLRGITGMPTAELAPCLKPATPRSIVIRMLNNLKVLHAKQDDWKSAWMVQERLVALKPTCFEERRDLAFIAMKLERTQTAIELFEDCLADCPREQQEVLIKHLGEAKRQLARWN
jgi:regulator of sirC expression with transglutaminase-like and TPR domain